jgi:hypothetical protein
VGDYSIGQADLWSTVGMGGWTHKESFWPAAEGEFCMVVSGGRLSQNVSTSAGQSYELGFQYFFAGGPMGADCFFDVIWNGQTIFSNSGLYSQTYHEQTLSVMGTGHDVLEFVVPHAYVPNDNVMCFDDMWLRQTTFTNNRVAGREGNDVIHLDNGTRDQALFRLGDGRDAITSFEGGSGLKDTILIDSRLASDFTALMSHGSQQGTDFVFDFGQDEIHLVGVSGANLNENDFVFANFGSSEVRNFLADSWGAWLS